ncbi:MAG: biopolymer transporter ExbD [Ferruginibacter sp.]
MSRGKIKRKSTSIDMTAMCDVAFLLLSFFILTAKFKPAEAVPISIPSSVASTAALLNTDAFVVSIDHTGKAYLELSDPGIRQKVLDGLQIVKGIQLAPDVQKKFVNASLIPVSIADLPQYLQLTPDQQKESSRYGNSVGFCRW